MYKFWTVDVLRFVTIFFTISVFVSMFFYPGGNIHDPSQLGYSISHNFLSDLGGYKSHSGLPNLISFLIFNFSMTLFTLIGISFLFIPKLFRDDILSFTISIIGSAFLFFGTFFFAGVGFTPYDLYLDEHIFFAINAFRLLVPGLILYFFVLIRSSVSKKYSVMIFCLLFFTFLYVVYQIISDSPLTSIEQMVEQAIIQKIITFVNIICMFFLSFAFSERLKDIKLN
ncbi:MAG: hypothetical protein CBD28_001760 [Rhizobiales bacterium TMED168]|nr:MAG: hypothetical protein CBD28_001760 [Rhizobiales bacterium TMED168]